MTVNNRYQSMDELKVIKQFRALQPLVSDNTLKTSVRLLAVFGFNGTEVIFATKEDNVYGFGRNRFGTLGLGVDDEEIPTPRLNATLSSKRLKNLYYGFGHCIGLTASGQLYAWGENDFGQLGIGSYESTSVPQLLQEFTGHTIVAVSCGNRHSLALTNEGEAWAWGRNSFGQIGDRTVCFRPAPARVSISEPIASLSCGKCHSLALTRTGIVYLWGLNDFGQLGRHRDEDQRSFSDGRPKERSYNECPELIPGFEETVFKKALCGPNHTLLLSADGYIHTMGHNDFGQIGNRCFDNQYSLIRIQPDLKFKDIVTNYDHTVCLAISMDNRTWIWGYTYHQRKIHCPWDVTIFTKHFTLFDVYAKYSGINKTFESIVFGDKLPDEQCLPSDDQYVVNHGNSTSEEVSVHNSCSMDSCDDNMPGILFQNHLVEAFDDQSDFDLVFVFKEDVIYCHKTILEIRNKCFWKSIEKYMENDSEVYIGEQYSYETMFSFIQYLYSMTPEVNLHNCNQLLELSHTYGESDLKDICAQCLQSIIDLNNICVMYETAINYELNSLENVCLKFAANDWKTICKSNHFQSMDEKLSQQFLHSIVAFKT